MVFILKYIFLGLLLYVAIIPILEQIVAIIVQWLENVKGTLLLSAAKLQAEINKESDDTDQQTQSYTNVIGFQLPEEIEYEEDYDEDD